MFVDNFYLTLLGLLLVLGLVKFSGRRPTGFRAGILVVCSVCVIEIAFPIEGKDLQLACLPGSSAVLLSTSQVYVDIIRKLNYTQKWVKEMADKG